MLNRKTPPASIIPTTITIEKPEILKLNNQTNLFYLKSTNFKVFELELTFYAGYLHGNIFGDSYFTSLLLINRINENNIQEKIDQLGGFIQTSITSNLFNIKILGLTEKFQDLVILLISIFDSPEFVEEELNILKNQAINNFEINKQKNSFLASKKYRELLFGDKNFNGKTLTKDDIEKISLKDCNTFFQNKIKNNYFDTFLSGNYTEQDFQFLLKQLETLKTKEIKEITSQNKPLEPQIFIEELEGSMQNSLRLGKLLFGRSNPDYIPFLVFNTVFGGYFGSRLMKNIREEKGFTYGISSGLAPIDNTGIFTISAEIKKDKINETIEQIKLELQDLQNNEISEDELTLVKNYLAGNISGSINNVFDCINRFKIEKYDNLPPNFYKEMINNILKVNQKDIIEMANKYVSFESLNIVAI